MRIYKLSKWNYSQEREMRVHRSSGVFFPIDDPSWITDLILQRTGPISHLGGQEALAQWFESGNRESLEALCRNEDFVIRFLDIVSNGALSEAVQLYPFVSGRRRVCSIGPGNGLIELFLGLHAQVDEFLLVDIENTSEHAHGYQKTGSGYASLEKTKQFLIMNGIEGKKITICNPKHDTIPVFEFDLLISIMSMGFHYPSDEYVNFVQQNCAESGLVIFDKRRGVVDAGYDELLKTFSLNVLSSNHKWERVILRSQRT